MLKLIDRVNVCVYDVQYRARIFSRFMGDETRGDLLSVQDFARASIFTDQD